jgi:hypothetical protein
MESPNAIEVTTRTAMLVAGGIVVVVVLLVVSIGVKLFDLSGHREDEAAQLQDRLTERLRPEVGAVPVTIVAHASGSSRTPVVIEVGGPMPTLDTRDRVLRAALHRHAGGVILERAATGRPSPCAPFGQEGARIDPVTGIVGAALNPMRITYQSVVAAGALFGTCSMVQADVPKPEDIAACNKEAQETVRSGSASPKTVSPNTKDASRAAQARRGETATGGADSTQRSDDPQLEGMDAEGAKDPVYQAAYRTCMRKSGF